MTWLVAAAGVVTGVALPLATLVTFLLTLRFLHLWFGQPHHPPERDRSPSKQSGAAQDPKTSSESALPKIREVRRRTRRERHLRLPLITATQAKLIPEPALHRFEDAEVQPPRSADDQWSGLLTVLALTALLLTGTALVRECTRLVEINERFSVFVAVNILGVSLLPVMIGILCRSEIHSILTMISLSAVFQVILFRQVASVPEALFLTLAVLATAGIPLGFVRFWGTIDRRPERGSIETTTGKLLRHKWQRVCTTKKHPACGSRRSS
jgi:hypothetical protein